MSSLWWIWTTQLYLAGCSLAFLGRWITLIIRTAGPDSACPARMESVIWAQPETCSQRGGQDNKKRNQLYWVPRSICVGTYSSGLGDLAWPGSPFYSFSRIHQVLVPISRDSSSTQGPWGSEAPPSSTTQPTAVQESWQGWLIPASSKWPRSGTPYFQRFVLVWK